MKLIDWLAQNPNEHMVQIRYHHGEMRAVLLHDGLIPIGIGKDAEQAIENALISRAKTRGET